MTFGRTKLGYCNDFTLCNIMWFSLAPGAKWYWTLFYRSSTASFIGLHGTPYSDNTVVWARTMQSCRYWYHVQARKCAFPSNSINVVANTVGIKLHENQWVGLTLCSPFIIQLHYQLFESNDFISWYRSTIFTKYGEVVQSHACGQ